MNLTTERLYQLLPAIYRIRDAEQGEPLKALIAVIAEQAEVIEGDIARLYENWFIETCQEWVVPYIGDLLGVRGLHSVGTAAVFTRRARVANTLSYRRRKGTATVLEQLALDTTGWRARAVEFFELLGTTQHYNHIRLHNHRTPDLRHTNELELLNTAFDTIAHTADVRQITNDRGRHNIPNIGLFLWRLQSYPITRGTARPAAGAPAGRFTFNPLGDDAPLFNRPRTEKEITHLAEEVNVPGLLRRRPLYDELEARRQAVVDGRTPKYIYFDDRSDADANPVLEIFLNGSSIPLSPDEILICDLQDWHIPSDKKTYQHVDSNGTIVPVEKPIQAAVDPLLGRLTFPAAVTVNQVQASYAYGFSGDVGGGPYNRQESVVETLSRKVTWQVGISKEIAPVPDEIFPTVTEAVEAWNNQPKGTVGVIAVMDSSTYEEKLTGPKQIKIPEGSRLIIVAADWPEVELPGGLPGEKHRVPGQLEADELRPHLMGDISVQGTAADSSLTGGDLVLDGLFIEGKLSVLAGNLGSLRVAHATLVPDEGGLSVNSKNDRLEINLVRSICGPIELKTGLSELCVEESIVDNRKSNAIAAGLTAVKLQKSTIFGSIQALRIEAGNCIFTDIVDIDRRQVGCVRFSYVPANSNTPRRYHCQPDLALKDAELSEQTRIQARLVPSFTSEQYGHYGYAQLSLTSAEEIRSGSEDSSEMGVFSILKQPQRTSNLRASMDEYLRLGLKAGLIYVT